MTYCLGDDKHETERQPPRLSHNRLNRYDLPRSQPALPLKER